MMAPPSRQRRRQLDRAAAGVDHVTAEDRAWFERRPDRQHRIRRMTVAEIATLAAVSDLTPLPPGMVRFTLLRKITPNLRMRAFILGPDHRTGDEAGESVAAALWAQHEARNPDARLRHEKVRAIVADHDLPRGGAA